jgi:hypothetical protein
MNCPTSTPWGHADQITKLADGIWIVSTPGHGGVYVNPRRLWKMPVFMRSTPYSEGGWFEEDCDWCLPFVCFESDIAAGQHGEGSSWAKNIISKNQHLEAFNMEYHQLRRMKLDAYLPLV